MLAVNGNTEELGKILHLGATYSNSKVQACCDGLVFFFSKSTEFSNEARLGKYYLKQRKAGDVFLPSRLFLPLSEDESGLYTWS